MWLFAEVHVFCRCLGWQTAWNITNNSQGSFIINTSCGVVLRAMFGLIFRKVCACKPKREEPHGTASTSEDLVSKIFLMQTIYDLSLGLWTDNAVSHQEADSGALSLLAISEVRLRVACARNLVMGLRLMGRVLRGLLKMENGSLRRCRSVTRGFAA